MFSIDLAEDAQLFPLEARHAQEFFAHIERGREFIGQYVGFPDRSTDLDSARALLAKYAVKAGRTVRASSASGSTARSSAGSSSRRSTRRAATARSAAGWSPTRPAAA